jgi:hypothetical protein
MYELENDYISQIKTAIDNLNKDNLLVELKFFLEQILTLITYELHSQYDSELDTDTDSEIDSE